MPRVTHVNWTLLDRRLTPDRAYIRVPIEKERVWFHAEPLRRLLGMTK